MTGYSSNSSYDPSEQTGSTQPMWQSPQQPGQPGQQPWSPPQPPYPPAQQPWSPDQQGWPPAQQNWPPAQQGWPPPPPPEYIGQYQAVRVTRNPRRRRLPGCCSCALAFMLPFALLFVGLLVYCLAPFPTRLLVLGIDRAPDGSYVGRSDTMILVSVNPLLPVVKMLSIPRDLWVSIPGVGENRINTAHFFAEAQAPGSGPEAAVQTVEENFNLPLQYYVRVRFDAILTIVDALGGVDLNLPQTMGGLEAGQHHLDGTQALAFVRDRKGTDDFFRMDQGQVMIKAMLRQMISPASWSRLPQVMGAVLSSVDTNLPVWQWPRIGLAFLRAGLSGSIDNRTIQREMTTPTITSGGASVLMPNWDLIHPYVQEMFR